MGARSLKRRPIKQHNLEPQASMASSRRKVGSDKKFSVLLLASLAIAVIGLFVIWSNSRCNIEPGVSYEIIRVVNEFPHDSDAFTQGLLYAENDTLFESTGLYGKSSVRKVSLHTGQIEVLQKMDDSLFGEGLTLIGERKGNVIKYWDFLDSLIYLAPLLQQFTHEMKDGWGLATDGKVLYGSDGSSTLYHIDPHTFKVISKQVVHFKGHQVHNLNELEFINGEIWANVYMTDCIAKISPKDGGVLGWILLPNLRQELIAAGGINGIDVLNGIAWDSEQKRVFVTGKLWPKLYEIRLFPIKKSFKEGVIEQLCLRKPFRFTT
ncbi:glutaminyl-peptide cyclotransferase-like [Prosopis cineraria]|uniref:glutaminyl-peptide cyclotransferase-like n=1 Tax=Prosopis cineraria TaxID=364024 RepID=UPI00241017B3|nr:glutaminyl-peptide cyclotransferase-like [Prosopis cineraria]